ncbi:MAG: hypothetical protein Kow001_17990 [Acidobacteriota bacterium]
MEIARAGNAREAVELLDGLPGEAAVAGEAWWELGILLFDTRHYAEAWECFRRLSEVRPHDGKVRVYQGLCEFERSDFERALIHIQQGRMLGLGDSPVLLRRARLVAGLLLNRMGEFQAAFESLEPLASAGDAEDVLVMALGLSALHRAYLPAETPLDLHAQVRLAGEAIRAVARHEFARADTLFQQLVERYSRDPGVHYAYGVFLMRDRKAQGLREFQTELEVNPWHVPALLQLAFHHTENGDAGTALGFAHRAVELEPGSYQARYALGWALLESGDLSGSLAELEKAVGIEPGIPELRFTLARAYQKAGRKEDAARERAAFQRLSQLKQQVKSRVNP